MTAPSTPGRRGLVLGALLEFAVLFALWLLLSDQRRWLYVGLGAASALVVTLLTHRIIATVLVEPAGHVLDAIRRLGWVIVFVVWLAGSIAAASAQIAYLVLNRRRPFQPRFVAFDSDLRRPVSRVVLALAITLVPGTMVVRLAGPRFLVHVLTPSSADDLASGRMPNLVARITGEARQPPPEMHWGPIIEEAVR